jgi:predicted TIM-barrel fold metal-dependent hydrolase
VGAHFASIEWSFDELAKRFERFPNMSVDIAERIGQIQYQTIEGWSKVRDFFIKYQDRIIYGMDLIANDKDNGGDVRKKVHDLWITNWRYFNTDDILESPFVNVPVKGLHLPKNVIDKFYYQNARRRYFD